MSTKLSQNRGTGDAGDMPLVSVVIPAYNAEIYIAEAVDSVLDQDYPEKEVIVIDDGSTDRTVDTLAAYGDRIRLLRQVNSGSAVARNAGIDAARGAYIAFLDGDDVWLPGKLSTQVAYMEQNPDVGMTQGRWLEWEQRTDGSFPDPGDVTPPELVDVSNPAAPIPELSGWIYHLLLTEFIVWTSVVMARKELIERVGRFDTRYTRGQDFQYWLRASRYTRIHKLDRVMALYRQHRGNSTRGCPARNYAMEIIDAAIAEWGTAGPDGSRPDPAQLRRHRARLWSGFAHKQLRSGRAGRAVRSFARAVAIHPLIPRTWMMLLASLLATMGLLRINQTDQGVK